MLDAGSPAPDIALEDTEGHIVHLPTLGDKQNVLVFFMRSTSCPICRRHVKDLVNRRAEFAANNVEVVLAVPEDRATATTWKASHDIPFRVVTGRRGSPHETVGLVKKLFGSMQQSGSVLIDAHGIVRHAHHATMPVNSYDKKGITAAIKELRAPALETEETSTRLT